MAFAQQDVRVAEALPAGTNNIGDVDIASALPTGANVIGSVGIDGSLPAGTNNIGDVDIASALPAGANSIGTVGIDTALPAGTNNIGDVDIASALPAGTNVIGEVGIDTAANTIQISQTGSENGVQIVAPLPAGTNNIGTVTISSTAGTPQETYAETGSVVPKNQGGTQTVQSALITNATTGTLNSVILGSRVGMTASIRTDDGTTQTEIAKAYIPSTGGQVKVDLSEVTKNQLAGDGVDNRFDVVFTNDDKNQDAVAHAIFQWSEA